MDIEQIEWHLKQIRHHTRDIEEILTPPVPDPKMLVGVNGSSEHRAKFPVARDFRGTGQGFFLDGWEQQGLILSLKPSLAQARELIKDAAAEWEYHGDIANLRLAVWHEPYDNMDVATWQQYQDILAQEALVLGFQPVAIFIAEAKPEWLAVLQSGFEVWLDPYDWSGEGKNLYEGYTGDRLVPSVQLLNDMGVPWGIAEFGTLIKVGQDLWLERQLQWFKDNGARGAFYFDRVHTNSQGETRDWKLTDAGLAVLQSWS